MQERPYCDRTIDQLEELVAANRDRVAVLGHVRVELERRMTDRAKQLLKEVQALVEGRIPKPKPPRTARRADQHSLFIPDSGETEQGTTAS